MTNQLITYWLAIDYSLISLMSSISYVPVKSKLQHPPPPPWAYPGHLTPFLTREGGNLITTHRGWGFRSLASMSCYEINHGGEDGDVKLWWIRRKRLHICGGLVENQRSTQAVPVFEGEEWFMLVYKYVLSNKPCLHAQLQKHNRSYWKVKTVIW